MNATAEKAVVYTLGYTGWSLEEVARTVEQLQATLVDVRIRPVSRTPGFHGTTLARRLGDAYLHVVEFGNENYRSALKPVRLVDVAAGIERVRPLVEARRPMILLCQCPDPVHCHRRDVAYAVARYFDLDVEHVSRSTP